jgi:hypothetical protein
MNPYEKALFAWAEGLERGFSRASCYYRAMAVYAKARAEAGDPWNNREEDILVLPSQPGPSAKIIADHMKFRG